MKWIHTAIEVVVKIKVKVKVKVENEKYWFLDENKINQSAQVNAGGTHPSTLRSTTPP